jgi:hypothetical protein
VNKTRLTAIALALALLVLLIALSVGIAQLALIVSFDSADSVLAATFSTIVDAIVLFLLLGALIEEWILARRERELDGTGVPQLLIGLVSLYSLVFWLFVGSILFWVSRLFGWKNLAGGFAQPESRLISNAVVLAFVLLSFVLLVWRYRSGWLRARLVDAWRSWRRRLPDNTKGD